MNNKIVKAPLDKLINHVERYHLIASGEQVNFERLVADLILSITEESVTIKPLVQNMIKMVPVKKLFNGDVQHVCDNGHETCPFYDTNSNPGCNYCQRGITNKIPHRLCPVA